MIEAEQLKKMRMEILKDAENPTKDDNFKSKLEDAKNIALDRIYPYQHEINELPERLQNWQVRAAIELYNRLGEEGITSYGENGLSYSYKTDLLSESLMQELPPPRAGVLS